MKINNNVKLAFSLGIIYQAFKTSEDAICVYMVEELIKTIGIEIPWHLTQGVTRPMKTKWMKNMAAALEIGSIDLYIDQLSTHAANNNLGVSWAFKDIREEIGLSSGGDLYTISHMAAEMVANAKYA